MRHFLKIISIFAFFAVYSISNAATKRILIEEFTSAGCQYCVRGADAAEALYSKYGNNVVVVAIHSNDSMHIDYSYVLAAENVFNISGIPSGIINRKKHISEYSGGKKLYDCDPSTWADVIENELAEIPTSEIDIKIKSWNINTENKTLNAVVEITPEKDISEQLYWNLYIMENGQNGNGFRWDQSNALSGDTNYKESRFYYLPPTIKGFRHDNVLLYMSDGGYGSGQGLPEKLLKGTVYTKNYEIDLTKLDVKYQNLNNLWIAATIARNQNNNIEIINVVSENNKPLPYYVPQISSENILTYDNIERGGTISKTTEIKNTTQFKLEIKYDVDTISSIIPKGWNINFKGGNNNKISLEPNQTAKISYDIYANADNPNYAEFILNFTNADGEQFKGGTVYATNSLLSRGAEIFIYGNNNNLSKEINEIPEYNSKAVAVPKQLDAVNIFDRSSAKVLILSEDNDYLSNIESGRQGNIIFNNLTADLINKNIPMIIISGQDLFGIENSDYLSEEYQMYFDEQAMDTYRKTFKIKAPDDKSNPIILYDDEYYPIKMTIKTSEHPVSNSLSLIDINDPNANIYLSSYADRVKSTDSNVSKIIMNYAFEGVNTPNDTTGAAAAITLAKSKALYFGFNINSITNANTKKILLNNSLAWLLGKSNVPPIEKNSANITVSPNPAENIVNIRLDTGKEDKGNIAISDINGKIIKHVAEGYLSNAYELNLSSFASGIYYVVATINGIQSIEKIVIKK